MLLQDLFAATVGRHADRIAVDVPPGRGRSVRQTATYRELAHMADVVASALRPLVAGESIVAVLLARDSPRLYAAQLAVLQAGGAHVCLDPSFPDQHVLHVLRDTAAVAVLTDAAGARRVAASGVRSFDVEALLASTSLPARTAATPDQSPPVAPCATPCGAKTSAASDHRLAYVVYTSGSTGVPKGVLLEHAGAVNLIVAGVERFGMGPDDRIAQGSSAAYDSSIEETWLAFASGATVVVLDDDTVRMGPDLAQWLRQQRVTVFCPPPTLMRAMDCRSPKDEMPDLRLCYVGGEALPSDLAALWGGAVWLENGYGPTECTVTVTRCRVHPGEPVSIGIPVSPNRAFVLDEKLQPVADGAAGELCISGPSVARGYLGAPDLNAARFPVLPGIGRVYRSGDLGHRDAAGRLFCHGRIDSQVKVRGYRIELEAIEAVLAACPGVREAACGVQGQDAGRLLVAHIVPDEHGAPPFAELERCVRRALPEYMVPARFAVIAALPRTIGGKLDRKALPPIDGVVIHGDATAAGRPQGERQQQLRAACAAVLGLRPEAVSVDDDFFALGGDSLRAAMLVSRLRRERESEPLAVRDIYSARTIRALAALAPEAPAAGPSPVLLRPLRQGGRPLLATALQTVWLAAAFAVAVSLLYLMGFWALPWLFATFDLAVLALLLPLLVAGAVLTYTALALLLAVAAKRLLIGRYRPLRAPVWSGFWVRHWIVVRMVRLVPWSLLRGTEFMNVALRLLGARIGRRVHIDREAGLLSGGWDLLALGDDVSLGREVALGLCELDDGDLVVGAVTIGNGAVLEVRSGTGADVEIGAGARLQALAHLPSGARLPAGERWDGVPARPCGRALPAPAISLPAEPLSPWRFGWQLVMARVLWSPMATLPLTLVVAAIAAMVATDGAGVAAWLWVSGPWSEPLWCGLALLLAVLALPLSLLLQALRLRWSLPVPSGTHDRWSALHQRHMLRNDALEAAGEWLAGTLFWPQWLRLAGMRIGRDCEISTIAGTLPEHVAIGGGSFLADGIYLGVCDVQAGAVTVAPTELGVRTFLGNHVVVPAGQRLPDDVLLGICTVADARGMAAGTAWFGQPPFGLPRREIVRADPRLTHRPGPLRFAVRVFWEAMRFVLPAVPALLWLSWFDVIAPAAQRGWWPGVAAALAATLAVALVQVAFVLATKWALLGRVRPGHHGLWSAWANRWDFHYVVWERCGRSWLSQLEGTLWLCWFLRAIGVRVGRRAMLGDGFAQVVDPDMLAIGDGATVQAMFQAHSFEDRVLKLDRVHVGRGANLGRGAVVLYGADVGDGAQVAPHSVVMKHERLSAGRHYAGVPTAEVAAAVPALRRAGRR